MSIGMNGVVGIGLDLWHINNHCRLFKAKSIYIQKTVLFQAIQFSISTQFSFIWPIDRTQQSTTTPGQSGPESSVMVVLDYGRQLYLTHFPSM